ncbi:MAG: rRNA pseudouridine synthase [Candidatus Berkelbacteria bacterium]|nr:rRNA pseudouridine synthase [Candidatus Berkelbacteria bacterium]
MNPNYPVNINKFISQSGLCSRRQADVLVKMGKVKIDNKLAKLIDKVQESSKVAVDGVIIPHKTPERVYIAYNKPVGVITTTDPKFPNNIISNINYPTRLFPIGRLDVNTSGLILLTNDGEIVNKILKGSQKVEKEYIVQVHKPISNTALANLQQGLIIDGFKTLSAKTKKIDEKRFSITIVEGKKRQVRRMCEKMGFEVQRLERIKIGKIDLKNIPLGKYIELSRDQIKKYLDI